MSRRTKANDRRQSQIQGRANAQRGAAALIVVMLLFFLLSLTAAYTSRNLIFEQKTSANQARSTSAFEAAEAGIEWALTQLNGQVVNDNCVPDLAGTSFQQRYLTIAADGLITQNLRAGGSLLPTVWPSCVFNGAGWNCACPATGTTTPSAPVGAGPFPAFRVWPATNEAVLASSPWDPIGTPSPMPPPPPVPPPAERGAFPMNVVGCTRLPATAADSCLDYLPRAEIGDGVAMLRLWVSLRSALATPPAAAVTARLAVSPYDPGASLAPLLRVVNTSVRAGGLSVHSGSGVNRNLFAVESLPGTPGSQSFADTDPRLVALATVAPATVPPAAPALDANERMFVNTFGMKRATYREQPGLRVCPPPCDSAAVNTLMQANPNRVIWVEGDLRVDANIGDPVAAADAPALLVVNGDTLTFSGGFTVYGLIYMTGAGSATATSTVNLPNAVTTLQGALMAEGALATAYTSGTPSAGSVFSVVYDAAAMDLLRTRYGTWVRRGGSWRDFRL